MSWGDYNKQVQASLIEEPESPVAARKTLNKKGIHHVMDSLINHDLKMVAKGEGEPEPPVGGSPLPEGWSDRKTIDMYSAGGTDKAAGKVYSSKRRQAWFNAKPVITLFSMEYTYHDIEDDQTRTAPLKSWDITQYVVACNWSDSIESPYNTVDLTIEIISGSKFTNAASEGVPAPLVEGWPEQAWIRISMPTGSPIDPGRTLASAKVVNVTSNISVSENGTWMSAMSVTAEGFFDHLGRAQVICDRSLPVGMSHGTMISFYEGNALQVAMKDSNAKPTGNDLSKVGWLWPALESLWYGRHARSATGKIGDMLILETADGLTHRVFGLPRVRWPQAAFHGYKAYGGSSSPYLGSFPIGANIYADHMNPEGMPELEHSGLIMPPVPGWSEGHLMTTIMAGGTVAGMIRGTFVCDRNLVELFPTMLYAPGSGHNVPALVYRMKPLRVLTPGSFVKMSQDLQKASKQYETKVSRFNDMTSKQNLAGGVHIGDGVTGSLAAAGAIKAGAVAAAKAMMTAFTASSLQAFGGESWGTAKKYAVRVWRNEIIQFSRTYDSGRQVNVVAGGKLTDPQGYGLHFKAAGVPISGLSRVMFEGVRFFRPQWPCSLMRSSDPDDQLFKHVMGPAAEARAISIEAAQVMLDLGQYAMGTCSVPFNPDIRPGRAVCFFGLHALKPAHRVSFEGMQVQGDPGSGEYSSKGEDPLSEKTLKKLEAEDIAENNKPLKTPVAAGDKGAADSVEYIPDTSYAYITSASHRLSVNENGAIFLVTTFQYDRLIGSEDKGLSLFFGARGWKKSFESLLKKKNPFNNL
jgi:hypothetical protein